MYVVRRVSLFLYSTTPSEIYTLSLHDALPIYTLVCFYKCLSHSPEIGIYRNIQERARDRKSTRLNSSHVAISYAVFCLKKKNTEKHENARERSQTGAARDHRVQEHNQKVE